MPHAPRVPHPPPPEAIAGLDAAGPRYASYPTPDRFVEAFGPRQYRAALRSRSAGAARGAAAATPLALYVHLPFCAAACAFCACAVVVTRQRERAVDYVDALAVEIGLTAADLGAAQAVSQLHLGGGTPTFLADAELARLLGLLHGAFKLLPEADVSIEVDPRTVDAARIARLRGMGFNRLVVGVQDFDAAVQRAVDRVHGVETVRPLLDAARASGFRSTQIELICGLPRQHGASFERTVATVCALGPERIALYGYAHAPHRHKPQRRIDPGLLPDASQRTSMRTRALAVLADAGYEHIGMDQFALPGDALAVARRQGVLHRDFQGYTAQPEGDLIGFGMSAIGRIGASYAQNAPSLADYHDALRHGRYATARGLRLGRDDLLRRSVIMALLCQGRVEFESVELAHLVDFRQRFAAELAALEPLAANGLLTIERGAIALTPLGGWFARAVAMVFDRPLQADRALERYSQAIL